MSTRREHVSLNIDTSGLAVAMARAARAVRQMARHFGRAGYTPGDRHVERIIRDCIDKRQTADQMRVRLLVASDVAAVLDDKERDA